jgi:hypothetical protein
VEKGYQGMVRDALMLGCSIFYALYILLLVWFYTVLFFRLLIHVEFMRDEGWARLLEGGNNAMAAPQPRQGRSIAASDDDEESGEKGSEEEDSTSENGSDDSDAASSSDDDSDAEAGDESGEVLKKRKKKGRKEKIARRAPSGRARATTGAAKTVMDVCIVVNSFLSFLFFFLLLFIADSLV